MLTLISNSVLLKKILHRQNVVRDALQSGKYEFLFVRADTLVYTIP